MNEEHFISGFIGMMLGFVVAMGLSYGSDNPREKQALEYGYAEIHEGSFMWKPEIEKRNIMKDYEFFKRNLKVPPTSPDIKIDDNSPWTKL